MPIRELETVRVIQLLTPARAFDGTDGVKRAPRVGDVGAIVHVYGLDTFTVECVDINGATIWLTEFVASELVPVA